MIERKIPNKNAKSEAVLHIRKNDKAGIKLPCMRCCFCYFTEELEPYYTIYKGDKSWWTMA